MENGIQSLSALVMGSVVEAALPMNTSHDALRNQLRKAVATAHGITDTYGFNSPYVQDVFPGHVVYQHQGQTYKRSYTADQGSAGSEPTIKLGSHKAVHVAYMDSQEAVKEAEYWEGQPYPVLERYISDKTRKKASPEDFAGKGNSFPILSPEDVQAALHSIGRAGADNYDSATLKANILKIAKRKGYAIPKTDQESVITTSAGADTEVRESVAFDSPTDVKESGLPATVPIKLIGPGWGSSAYYPEKMLKNSGPQVFKAGTHMYWNHATESQMQERPEGDLSSLAAVLTKDAVYKENGPKGPGLYSEAKVFSDYAQQVKEKGPHIGVSIHAGITGIPGEAEGRKGLIAETFTRAFSTDFVTKAGAKGQPVLESQRGSEPQNEEHNMTAEEIKAQEKAQEEAKKLQETTAKENETLKAKIAEQEARENKAVAVATVAAILKEAEIEYRPSFLEMACSNPVMKEGKADVEWVKGIVAHFTPEGSGRVKEAGDEHKEPANGKDDPSEKRLREALTDLGVPKAGLDVAVAGRL